MLVFKSLDMEFKDMSHLVRRTKKCCTKLLRKITFNDNLSCPSTTKPSQSTIYAQQKNHQTSGGRRKIAPSPQHSKGILFARSNELNSNLDGLSLDDDDTINMNTFSTNKNFRFDNNIKKCFRIQKQNYVPQENEDDKNKSSNNNLSSSYDMKNSIFLDEEIIFTENKIYISATERNLKQCKSNNKVDKKPFAGNCNTNFNSVDDKCSELLDEFLKMCTKLSSPFRLWFGQYLVVFVDKAEDMKIILNSENCIEKSFIYRFFQQDVALFTAPAHIWRPNRKLLNPTFNFNILNSFIPIFNDKANLAVRNLEKELGNDYFDISKYLFACTLDMVCATSLGYDVGVQCGKNQDYLEAVENSLTMIAQRIANIFYHPDIIYQKTNSYKAERKYFEISQSLPNKIINTKKKEFLARPANDESVTPDDDGNHKTPQIFIEQMFQLYEKGLVDDKMMEDQVALMIFGGNETSALATSHIILMLAMHPDIQEKAMKELEEIYDDEDQVTDSDKLSKLSYLEMIMKETHTVILMSLHHLHRNKDTWGPHADSFDPDNFLPEKMATRHSHCFLPFSSGPRGCIGMKYGYMSVKIIISALLRRYKFTTKLRMEDLKWKFELTQKLIKLGLSPQNPALWKSFRIILKGMPMNVIFLLLINCLNSQKLFVDT
ncbi:Cytochrome P450 4c21 [Pseudolycoriella hygida]|uniref:Cytochrome P450 4c21 n=1 Tax=Pseudolycoriella hygida TaxID=35572 RepID=A0A9Q0N6H2_9DIPT|nr:Cytochrome P450 4c21 [Pseudolycoriella hygida]